MIKSLGNSCQSKSISIVIPCYNTAEYVDECIQSVLCQTLLPNELIIVNDGSTDNTLEAINIYKEIEGVLIISTPNRGLGSARNTGAKCATSEYICFLDSDDRISLGLLARFKEEVLVYTDLDLFVFSFQGFDSKSGFLLHSKSHVYRQEYQGRGPCVLVSLLRDNYFHSSACCMIMKTNCIDWTRSGFKNILHEDEEMTPKIFIKSSSVRVSSFVGYYYRISRPNSIMTSMTSSSKIHWLRSRYGYSVSFFWTVVLVFQNIHNSSLSRALLVRSRYLATHAILPFVSIVRRRVLRCFDRSF